MADILEYVYNNTDKTKPVDHFDKELWEEAFKEFSRDIHDMKSFELDEVLPWDHIDVGVKKEFLLKEWEKAQNESLTDDCRWGCLNCGVNLVDFGGVCNAY